MAQAVEKDPAERERVGALKLLIVPGGVCGGRGTTESGGKSHFPEQKNASLRFLRPKIRKISAQLVDAAVGELAPPSACLSKTFLKS